MSNFLVGKNIFSRQSTKQVVVNKFTSKLIVKLLTKILVLNKNILLSITDDLMLVWDRANWKFGSKNINRLTLGFSYKNLAFPLMFKMLDKARNLDTEERII